MKSHKNQVKKRTDNLPPCRVMKAIIIDGLPRSAWNLHAQLPKNANIKPCLVVPLSTAADARRFAAHMNALNDPAQRKKLVAKWAKQIWRYPDEAKEGRHTVESVVALFAGKGAKR